MRLGISTAKHMSRLVILLFCCFSLTASAQKYFTRQYRVEKGLPSDIIKACTQDSLGYYWIATDEGLVSYDGIRFTSYRKALHDNYAKGFFTTKNGKLLAFGDLDLIEIQNSGDTVSFKKACPVSRVANDSSLSYPKSIFEDIRDDLWISESQSVVRLHDKSFKRYSFDLANRTTQFLRSFTFFEDRQHNLFVSSFQGNVFRYNLATDAFDDTNIKFPFGVERILATGSELIIGSADGISVSTLAEKGNFDPPKLKMKIPFVSFVAPVGGKYFVTTRNDTHYIADLTTNTFHAVLTGINNINHVYVSKDDDMLLSGNEGWTIMREDLFQDANESVADFIESIVENPNTSEIYYVTSRTLYSYEPTTKKNTTVFTIPTGYFQSLLYSKHGIWAANAFKLLLLNGNKVSKEFDFTNSGRFITSITEGSKGNIWLTIPGNPYAYSIDSSYQLHRYTVPLGDNGVINMIREGAHGTYIASAGKNSYLFFKPENDTVFKNISQPITFETHGDFNVINFSITGDTIWMASTEGLIKCDPAHVERVNLGDGFTSLPVKSISLHPENKLLLANAFGMLLYDIKSGNYDLFNENSGLLSNTITTKGLFVNSQERIWIGTAKGLCYSTQPLTVLRKTPKPRFTQFQINGKNVSLQNNRQVDYGSFISIDISSIMFPSDATLQYRLSGEQNWRVTTESTVIFSALAAGQYTLEARTKKNGPYTWSEISSINFGIKPPFWHRWWFFVLCAIGLFLLIVLTITVTNVRIKRRNKELELIVDDRTKALRLSNEELIQLNLEKNNLIEIVAHDLKTPLSQLQGMIWIIRATQGISEESTEYLDIMEKSVSRLNEMITKILNVDVIESQQLNLKMEVVDLSEILESIVERHRHDAEKKNISIVQNIMPSVFATADKNYAEQVLENLVSNAIKFSPFDRKVFVNLGVAERKIKCEIKDEGPGLSAEDKKKLFGKYQKLTARPTGNEISTGLGLSIAKRFVEAMGGEIWCESEVDKGASFFVTFKTG